MGGTRLAHLRAQDHAHRLRARAHGQDRPEVADHRRDHVAAPRPVGGAMGGPPAQPQGRAEDRLLAQGAKALPLEPDALVLHLAAREERLEPVVGRAREDHPAQELAPLRRRDGGGDRLAAQEAVAGLDEVRPRAGQALGRFHAGRRLGQARRRRTSEALPQRLAQGRPQGVEGDVLALVREARDRLAPGVEGEREGRVGPAPPRRRRSARAGSDGG
jgi:hypothetical protein